MSKTVLNFSARELFRAWLIATVFSGAPSTLYAVAIGTDPLEATRAAGAMVMPPDSSPQALIAAAGVIHFTVSLFWTAVLGAMLPRRHVLVSSVLASAAIAVLDLRIIAPVFFPSVAALDFWPQFADHLMWGACVGLTLRYSSR